MELEDCTHQLQHENYFLLYHTDSLHLQAGVTGYFFLFASYPNLLASFPGRPTSSIPPPYLHTVSDQILEVGTAWEQGYQFAIKIKMMG